MIHLPALGMTRYLELLITRGRIRTQTSGDHPIDASWVAVLWAAAAKPSMAMGRRSVFLCATHLCVK